MAQFTNIVPTTELEAANELLATIAQAPIAQSDLDTPGNSDVSMAVSILRNAAREVLSIGWRFNSRRGVEVAPTAQYTWVASDSTSTVLNVFKRPSGYLSWRPTECYQMADSGLVEALSLRYQETGAAALILFDTYRNRDGLEAVRYPFVYIDGNLSVDFERLPEEARRYIAVLASRRFAAKNAGAQLLVQLSQEDEEMAFRILTRAHGIKERNNLFDNAESREILGHRPHHFGGFSRRIFRQ